MSIATATATASEVPYLPERMATEWRRLRDAGLLLDGERMARFVVDGYLRFEGIVPDELNRAVLEGIAAGTITGGGGYRGEQLWSAFTEDHPIGRVFRLPAVRGIIASLVGPEPQYDHHAVHVVPARTGHAQMWHADAAIDIKPHFDIQVMYYPHAVTRPMGGTLILPGSQFRMVHESEVGRYQNFRGQLHTVCPPGTLQVVHHNIWHCAQPNSTDTTRYMFKLRLNPTVRQQRLWDTRRAFDAGKVHQLFNTPHPWHGSDGRLEFINRIRLWRLLTGDPAWDDSLWLGRIENDPQTIISE
jgi:hypothetical protein